MTTPTDPRICIVGAGGHASRNIYPWIGKAEGQLVGVCDLNAELAARNARRFGGKPYTDLDAMLDAESPDGVIVCIGPEQHAALALKLIDHGVPVYTEKPPAPSAAEALKVARAAKAKNVLCVTAFKKRYAHVYTRAKQWLDGFDPAQRQAIAVVRGSGPYSNESPRFDLLLDFEVHMIDLVQHLFGDAAQVHAMHKDKHAYAISIVFTCGAVGSMSICDGRSFAIPTEKVELTVAGGHFMSIDNSSHYKIAAENKCTEWYDPPVFTSAGDAGRDSGHLPELIDFFQALREGRKTSRSDVAASYRSMALYEAIAKSAVTGKVEAVVYETV